MIGSDLEGADLEACAWILGFRFDGITVKGDLAAAWATSQGTITIRATGETQPARLPGCSSRMPEQFRRGLLRHLASLPPGFGSVPQPLAFASTTRLTAAPASACPYRGRAGRHRRSGS